MVEEVVEAAEVGGWALVVLCVFVLEWLACELEWLWLEWLLREELE